MAILYLLKLFENYWQYDVIVSSAKTSTIDMP